MRRDAPSGESRIWPCFRKTIWDKQQGMLIVIMRVDGLLYLLRPMALVCKNVIITTSQNRAILTRSGTRQQIGHLGSLRISIGRRSDHGPCGRSVVCVIIVLVNAHPSRTRVVGIWHPRLVVNGSLRCSVLHVYHAAYSNVCAKVSSDVIGNDQTVATWQKIGMEQRLVIPCGEGMSVMLPAMPGLCDLNKL